VARHLGLWVAAAAIVSTQGALVAWAATNTSSASDGGDTVKVGVSSATSATAKPVHRGTARGSAGSGPSCTYTPTSSGGAPTVDQGSPIPGSWYLVHCSGTTLTTYNGALSWFPSTTPAVGGTPAVAETPSVAPSALVLQAVGLLTLPRPVINLNPAAFSVVNLTSWLWVSPQTWHSFRATATAGAVSATATAVPQFVSWSMGDGHTVLCPGPGTPYQTALPSTAQSTDCSYTYAESSAGQPSADGDANDSAFTVTATITWSVSWLTTGVTGGGSLLPLHTATSTAVRVEQVESVGTAG